MASNWKFYPQSPLVALATITDDVGTATGEANILNPRMFSKLEVDTVSAGRYRVQIDVGSGNTISPDFLAVVYHNLYTDTATVGLTYSSTDTLSGTSPAGVATDAFAPVAMASGDQPLFAEVDFTNVAKRYWWLDLTNSSNVAYAGCVLIGNNVEPSVDPNWESPIEIDIESGRIVNSSFGGYNFKTRTHDIKRGWQVKYQFISDADLAILEAWLEDESYVDSPFVFTNNGGTNYYYGELLGNPVKTPVQAGLTNYEFTIGEVIA